MNGPYRKCNDVVMCNLTFLGRLCSVDLTEAGNRGWRVSVSDVATVLEALPMPALVIDGDSRIAIANPGAERLLGRGIAGRHFLTILRQPAVVDAVQDALRLGGRREAMFTTAEASRETTFRVTVATVAFSGGQGVVVAFEDMTPLQEVDQIRRDFVANVSHELRTPLTAMIGFIETLKGAARDDAPARERFLTIMEREAARMNRLVQDLLSLSRVEAEERVRPTERVEIGRVALMALATLRPMAAAQGARVETDGLDTGATVRGDPDQLAQVFTNLIENALKYGRRGGVVRITLEERAHEPMLLGPAVVVAVADDGDGIDPVHISRLTERFYRVDSHRSREMGGTGLGLAIVKHIVNRHRGRLRITSEPGEGSRFEVQIPAAPRV
jgi:two-component system phosphate regulon sensor histidine kinase PhoR